jgi:hypothetical protein
MNVEIRTEAARFPLWKFSVPCLCSACIMPYKNLQFLEEMSCDCGKTLSVTHILCHFWLERSIPLTSGSGSGSGRPKNMWIRIRNRIRIRIRDMFGRGLYGGNKVYKALVYTDCIESIFCIILKIEKNRSQNSRKNK